MLATSHDFQPLCILGSKATAPDASPAADIAIDNRECDAGLPWADPLGSLYAGTGYGPGCFSLSDSAPKRSGRITLRSLHNYFEWFLFAFQK